MQTTKQSTYRKLVVADAGLTEYGAAWELQKRLQKKRMQNEIPDTLILLEHPHTYTLGKAANKENLIAESNFIQTNNIAIFETDRGGDVTYHGPGQIVGYAILNLAEWKKDAHEYLRAIEETVIKTCKLYGVTAARNSEYTGVWVGENKICAIGVKITRWVTMHGFAFNISTDLDLFNGIIPCGIKGKGVTSLNVETEKIAEINDVKEKLIENFAEVFGYEKIERKNSDYLKEI